MELRNICNHPYLSQLHSEEVSFQGNAFLVDSVHCQQRKRQIYKWVVYMCVLMKAGGNAADRKSSPSSLLAPHGPFLWKA
jgi:hypothetical protein